MDARSRRTDLAGLEAHALAQGGYFDRGDAHAHGLDDRALHYHTKTSRFERLYPGVYRLRIAPFARHDDVLRAWVWSNYRGVISHESALALYELSDVMPGHVHLTVPFDFGRNVPPDAPFVLHRSQLQDSDVGTYEGVAVTTPARSIVDAAAGGTGPEQIHKAVRDALRRAFTTADLVRAAAARPGYRHRRTVQPLVERAITEAAGADARATA
jgi:predicted transcriptional regulator of viral defense system